MRASSSLSPGAHGQMAAIQAIDEIDGVVLAVCIDALGGLQVQDGLFPRAKARALKRGRHEARAPHALSAGRLLVVIQQHDEAGQVAVFASQAVGDPRAQARPAGENAARVHLAHAAHVVESVGPAGTDHAEIVHAVCQVRIPVGDG